MRDLTETTAEMVDRQTGGARLRVLVVGAGIAGSALAGLLRSRGQGVAVIERARPGAGAGYMLGLLPLGAQVLGQLGLGGAYRAASQPMHTYDLYGRTGALVRHFPLAPITDRFGDWRGIDRGALLDLLHPVAGDIAHGVTVTALTETPGGVAVRFSDDSQTEVDLVVGADGVHSGVRRLVFPADDTSEFDTGWGGHVLWARPGNIAPDTYAELWSAGWGIGLYPVPGRVGIFLAGRGPAWRARGAEAQAEHIAARLGPGVFRDALEARRRDTRAQYWKMADIRAANWSRGRVVLLGDAAASFLPTAGAGASAALSSAAALAAALDGVGPRGLAAALADYEAKQRPKVERMQDNSRRLARYMFIDSRIGAALRDQLLHFYTLDRLIDDIAGVMAET